MERRSLKRIQVPGAKVRHRRLTGLGVFNIMSKPSDIVDISKSGLSFEINEELESGESIQVKLIFPDGKSFDLKGKIRWYKQTQSQNIRVGIQFTAFGSNRRYNPVKALEYLRNMEGQKAEKRIKDDSENTDT